jgi:hypothetical protein
LEFARDEVIRDQQLIALVGYQFNNGSWHSSSLPPHRDGVAECLKNAQKSSRKTGVVAACIRVWFPYDARPIWPDFADYT